MNCPSCQQELAESQLACPRCGYLPGFGPAAAPADSPIPADQPPVAALAADPASLADPSPDTPPASDADPGAGAPTEPVGASWAEALTEPVDTSWAAPPEPGAPEPTLAFATPEEYAATHPSSGYPAQPAFLAPGQVPPAGYGPPGYASAAAAPAPEWMSATPPKRHRLLLPILLLSLAVLVAGGGVAFAGHYFLGWFGGVRRPADVLPGTAVTYVQVDLNPSLVQQASAWRFLRDLPEVKEAAASGAPDPKAIAWKLLTSSDNPLADVDYERDLKPWLGDRFGMAMLPAKSGAANVFAVEVKDEARARTALAELSAKGGTPYDVTMRSGYALLTQQTDTGEVLAALDAGALAANPTFATDFASLGDPGVFAGWSDLAGAARLGPAGPDPRVGSLEGRVVYALGFTPDSMTLAGKAVGLGDTGITGTADLGLLPASTWAAAGFAGGGKALEKIFPSVESYLKGALEESGLDEGDLVAILGRSLSIGLGAAGDEALAGGMPDIGLRVESDDAPRAKAALDKLFGVWAGAEFTVGSRIAGDVLVVSTSPTYLDRLANPVPNLAGNATFTKAVPDHARATAALYVDLPTLWKGTGVDGGEYQEFLSALLGVGGEYVADGAGSGSWSLRVVRS